LGEWLKEDESEPLDYVPSLYIILNKHAEEEVPMVHCTDMKKGEIYHCEECGLEFQIIKECQGCGTSEDTCEHVECRFVCCDRFIKRKQ